MTNRTPHRNGQSHSTPLLALALGVITTSTVAAAPPDSISLTGVVRDFRPDFPDFRLVAGSPSGAAFPHVAGALDSALNGDGNPVLTGGAYVVDAQWTDSIGDPIAPNLYGVGAAATAGQILLTDSPLTQGNYTLDSYDPAAGAYGGSNVGPAPDVLVNAIMPVLPIAPDLGPSLHNVEYNGNGTSFLMSSFLCDNFRIRNNHTVIVQGDITLVVDNNFDLENRAELQIPDGSSLTVFIFGWGRIWERAMVNMNSADHERLTIYNMGNHYFEVLNYAQMYASILSPGAELEIENNADFYGTVAAQGLELENFGGLHIAGSLSAPCTAINDIAGAAGASSNALVTDASMFSNWFASTPNDNATAAHTLVLEADAMGTYTFNVADFTPINSQLFGNDVGSNNRNFTYEISAQFTTTACAGHFFEFMGAGDVWVFIDGQLVLDLGGAQMGGWQIVHLDRLELNPAGEHELKFFYAQRVGATAPFRIRTNIPMHTDSSKLPTVMAMYD